MKVLLLAALLLGLPVPQPGGSSPRAGDFWPEREGPDPYEGAVAQALLRDEAGRRCVLLVIPSFRSEWAVYLSGEAPNRSVVLRTMRIPLWNEMHAQALKDAPNSGGVSRSAWPKALAKAAKVVDQVTAPISVEVATKLELAWQSVLARVPRSKKSQGMVPGNDGAVYRAAQCGLPGCLTGIAWSPEKDSVAGHLVDIGEAMHAYASAVGTREKEGALLRSRTEALARLLADNERGKR